MKKDIPRVAFFSCVYHEVDGVAKTSRHFEAFAKHRGFPLLMVHAGPRENVDTEGSVTRIQFQRSPLTLPLDRAHKYDLLFWRQYRRVESLVRDFQPQLVQITGPSDVGMLGTLIAHRLRIPLAASWQTNLHQYARSRAEAALPFLPKSVSSGILNTIEQLSFRAALRFYKCPQLLFAPNQEIMQSLETSTGKPCFIMPHAVDTEVFTPDSRNRDGGPFQIGYVGRLTPEKGVRSLARLENALLQMGHRDFRIVVVGEGGEEAWLRDHLRQAEFRGVLTGLELSQMFANLDVLVFPSETDTFGLVVLEAFASGVPAVVTGGGGPKFTVNQGRTGYVAHTFDEFVACTVLLMERPDLLSEMRIAARQQALTTSWDRTFDGMYEAYNSILLPAALPSQTVFNVATT